MRFYCTTNDYEYSLCLDTFQVGTCNQFSTQKYVVFWLEIKHHFFPSIRFITMISCFKRECPSGLFPLSVPNRDGLRLCINHFYITHKNDIFCYAHFNDAIWYLIKYRNSCQHRQLCHILSCSPNRFQFINCIYQSWVIL